LLDAVGVEAGQRVTAATNGGASGRRMDMTGMDTVRESIRLATVGGDCAIDERGRVLGSLLRRNRDADRLGVLLRAIVFAAAVGLTWNRHGFFRVRRYLSLIPENRHVRRGVRGGLHLCSIGAGAIRWFMRARSGRSSPRVAVETPVLEGGTRIKARSELAQDIR